MAVYFIQGERGGPIKIGYSREPHRRLSALQTSHSERLIIVGEIDGDRQTECELHARLRSERISGEWFKPSDLTKTIMQLACDGLDWLAEFPPIPKPKRKSPYKKKEGPRELKKNPKHPIDREAPASLICARFGGLTKLSRALERRPSTVQRWLMNGYFPSAEQPAIIAAAVKLRIKLKPSDFVDQRLFAKPALADA